MPPRSGESDLLVLVAPFMEELLFFSNVETNKHCEVSESVLSV